VVRPADEKIEFTLVPRMDAYGYRCVPATYETVGDDWLVTATSEWRKLNQEVESDFRGARPDLPVHRARGIHRDITRAAEDQPTE
jgi:hypothetical protein